MNPRKIYNINDLQQITGLNSISQEQSNNILHSAYKNFFYKFHSPRITDRIRINPGHQYVLDGKLVLITLGIEKSPIKFGETTPPKKRVEFRGIDENWREIDGLYLMFSENVLEKKEKYVRMIRSEEKRKDLMEELKKLTG